MEVSYKASGCRPALSSDLSPFCVVEFPLFFFFFKNLSSFEQESDWRNLNALNC